MKPTAGRSLTGARGGGAEQSGWRVGRPGRRRSCRSLWNTRDGSCERAPGCVWPGEAGGFSLQQLVVGFPWGTASWVRWRPLPVRVRRWSRVGSAVQPRGQHRRALPATAAPRRALLPSCRRPRRRPPARAAAAAAAAASSAAAAAPPAPAAHSDSSRGGCQPGSPARLLPFPSPLLALSPPPPRIHSLLLFAKLP